MAHFAKIGIDNKVLGVLKIGTNDNMDDEGVEREECGIKFLQDLTGHETWVQCSYNTRNGTHKNDKTPLRVNYPAVGWYYDSTNDMFHPPRPVDVNGNPCNSWTLNTSTGQWEPPLPVPGYDKVSAPQICDHEWNETNYQEDNTTGWVPVIGTGVEGQEPE